MPEGIEIEEIEAALLENPLDQEQGDAKGDAVQEAAEVIAGKAEVAEAKPEEKGDGFPNPLGLTLTPCHLPQEFISDRRVLLKYIGRHLDKRRVSNISQTANERALYQAYIKLSQKAGQRPLIPRSFSAAVRLVAAGKPLTPVQEDTVDSMAL